VYHHVSPGQTLWSIARAYGVDVQTLARANQLSNTNALEVGQKLYIPGATQQRAVASRCPCEAENAKTLHSRKPSPVVTRLAEQTPVAKDTSTRSSGAQDMEGVLPVAFVWPLLGEVTRGFEPDGTRRHDGLDIVAPKGTPIQAAADGEVIFSGIGPGGYGRIVILQHQADMVTVYAHNEANLVSQGQHVQQGDYIATVGRSGRATGDHLHFEIRHRTVPVAPEKWLPRRQYNMAALEQG
jgi:murein DD-endopeptidase MepM/ murein hydrolase activator NlpD